MNRTKISYLDYTWNPLTMRCTPVSEGCAHCWHLRMANRLAGNDRFPDDVRAAWAGEGPPVLIRERLEEPARMRKPARIGVQFMGDLFHENVRDRDILDVWRSMHRAPQHTFLILTKRTIKMLDILYRLATDTRDGKPQLFLYDRHPSLRYIGDNIWLGTSIEAPKYSYRAEDLRNAPAAKRFLSLEPLLASMADYPGVLDDMDLVLVGGESGLGARPMHPDWARGVRDQCVAADVKFWFKQWGAFRPTEPGEPVHTTFDYDWANSNHLPQPMTRTVKKMPGDLLDGEEWRQWPN